MSKKSATVKLFIAIFLFIFTINTYAEEHYSTLPQAQYLTPQTVKDWQNEEKKLTLVDVRESSEYKAGHLDEAINIRYLDVEKKAKAKDNENILSCVVIGEPIPASLRIMVVTVKANI